MKFKNFLLAGVALVGLAGCGSDCSEDELQEKMMEITTKVQAMVTSGDAAKMMEFSTKAAKIGQSSGADGDLQAACEAADELLSEL